MTWQQVSCTAFTEGPMHLGIMPGGNSYYSQFVLSNAAQQVTGGSINRQALKAASNGRWELSNNGKELDMGVPLQLDLTGAEGGKMQAELQSWTSQTLGGQF